MKLGDSVAYALDLVLLFFVCLLPFATALMVTHLKGQTPRWRLCSTASTRCSHRSRSAS